MVVGICDDIAAHVRALIPYPMLCHSRLQATALSFHTAIMVVGAFTCWYILKSHWLLAGLSAVAGYAMYRFPRYSTYVVLAVAVPVLATILYQHWMLTGAAATLAVVAYMMADPAKKEALHAAANDLYGPVKASLDTIGSNAKTTATIVGDNATAATRRIVHSDTVEARS